MIIERTQGFDRGGPYTEFYTESASGRGLVQRWYGPHDSAPTEPTGEWYPLRAFDGPDRTDPGYYRDCF